MFELPKDQSTDTERAILKKLRVWIAALAISCVVAGIGIGAILTGRPVVAQNDAQIAKAPEALSASFVEIAKRVEPAVRGLFRLRARQRLQKAARNLPFADDAPLCE